MLGCQRSCCHQSLMSCAVDYQTRTQIRVNIMPCWLVFNTNPFIREPMVLLPVPYMNIHQVNVLSCLEAAFSKVPPTLDVFAVLTQDCGVG